MIALITGASSGIGREFAKQLSSAHVAVADGKEEAVTDLLGHIMIIHNVEAVIYEYLLHLFCSDRILTSILDEVQCTLT